DGRRGYTDIVTPNFADICASLDMAFQHLDNVAAAKDVLGAAVKSPGPAMVEVDMISIGDFAVQFSGPPVRIVESRDK
ncbi:hypothetical protein OAJ57_05375, partial [Alphaproteobacteria bacterium]|nr:hypothetical protein [Alphaproteobacteria bacterium]